MKCDMDCFNCGFADCINDSAVTAGEIDWHDAVGRKSDSQKHDMMREISRRRYHRNKAAGICVYCGRREAVRGIACRECSEVRRARDRRRSYRDPAKDVAACVFCGEDVLPGYRVCARHYDIVTSRTGGRRQG